MLPYLLLHPGPSNNPLSPPICRSAALARIFSMKLGVLPDHVLPAILVDRLVLKGTVLQFTTEFFKDFLATDTVEVRFHGIP